MPPVLPPEILLCIADHCLYTYPEHFLWFNLGQTSRLFRDVVENYVMYPSTRPHLDGQSAWQAWNSSLVVDLKREAGADSAEYKVVMKFLYARFLNKQETWWRTYPGEWDPYKVQFTEVRRKIHINGMRNETAGPATKMIRRSLDFWVDSFPGSSWCNSHKNKLPQTLTFGQPLETWERYWQDGSDKAIARISSTRRRKLPTKVICLAFDWRRMWSIKCAAERAVASKRIKKWSEGGRNRMVVEKWLKFEDPEVICKSYA